MPKFIRTLLTLCAAGLVSYGFPRLLIAAGVPLDAWIVKMGTWLGAPPDWVNFDTAIWLFTLVVGFVLFGAEVWWHPVQKVWQSIARSKVTTHQSPQTATEDLNSYVSLKEGATIAYEETRGTKAATIAEGLNRDDILGYYAYALFKGSTLYGKHPPSRKLEPVPREEYGRCGISDEYSSLRRHGEDQNFYEDLQIRRSDLLRRITELKDLGAALSREERARKISKIYGNAVALRNHVFSLRVVDAASEVRMNDFQSLLIEEMRELAPERTINLETINVYNELDHPLCNLQDRTRAMVFSEILLRVKKILEDYK